ncbi:hypothetical protein P154DRAFT_250130 [Amniculicola lignicola CBS 123094]|uniref:Uncharacterized protein n=1 Tax=Amniculicola lignicola CBS 123094 TaxID=1392246 RepID=A0A6A5WB58_9PLEO|nr:hypothetical protein P154DRAFT_250130 [Amniculicola lignicola CBS 123094]
MRVSSYIPTIQAKFQAQERTARIAQSDLKFQTGEAEKYKNQVYGLQVDLESVESRMSEEIQTLKDKLMIVEGERDALKTSLREEEVMRIAAEGQIALPAMTAEENDEFGSPVRSPRKRNPERDEEDKENVAPRKATVEIKFLQQELASEKRLRERAQEQIDFMKMECQFQCCSCRVADLNGAHYVHDNSYAVDMEMIKASVPVFTPPSSAHGDGATGGVVIKQEPDENERPATASSERVVEPPEHEEEMKVEEVDESKTLDFSRHATSVEPEATVAFSPTTGTFRSFPSPVKAVAPAPTTTPAKPSRIGLSAITEVPVGSSPWTPDANSTVIPPEPASPSLSATRPGSERKLKTISIHEDAIVDDEEDEDMGPQTPLHDPSGPATPHYVRTVTMTTKIPLHFSPMTPAIQKSDKPMTPSTIAHAPTNAQAQAQVLGELSLNKLPFDREAALEAIRERRGRARSMAAGHGTPMKQMLGGVKERRDISAPVSRVRR